MGDLILMAVVMVPIIVLIGYLVKEILHYELDTVSNSGDPEKDKERRFFKVLMMIGALIFFGSGPLIVIILGVFAIIAALLGAL